MKIEISLFKMIPEKLLYDFFHKITTIQRSIIFWLNFSESLILLLSI